MGTVRGKGQSYYCLSMNCLVSIEPDCNVNFKYPATLSLTGWAKVSGFGFARLAVASEARDDTDGAK